MEMTFLDLCPRPREEARQPSWGPALSRGSSYTPKLCVAGSELRGQSSAGVPNTAWGAEQTFPGEKGGMKVAPSTQGPWLL